MKEKMKKINFYNNFFKGKMFINNNLGIKAYNIYFYKTCLNNFFKY